MLYDVVEVKLIKNYVIYLRFENGVQGELDISELIKFEGVFSKLQDQDYFATVYLNKELGTIVWDNGADFSPSYLYSVIKNQAA